MGSMACTRPAVQTGLFAFLSLSLSLTLSSCNSNSAAPGLDAPRSSDGFALHVLDDSYAGSGLATIGMEVEPGEQVAVSVAAADAHELKALYFRLDYDPSRYAPVEVQTGGLAAGGTEKTLELAVLSLPGIVDSGQVLVHPGTQPGFSGAGELARVIFERRPFAAEREVSTPPVTTQSQAQLTIAPGTTQLHWGYWSQGDYDQNGMVNISDLTPLGSHFKESVPSDLDSIQAVINGDGNVVLNISDLTPIGVNYLRQVSEWRVYSSASAGDYPASPVATSTLTPVGTVPKNAATGSAPLGRLQYSYDIPAPVDGNYYWVRPSDGASDGTASTAVQYAPPNAAPSAALTADVLTGPATLDVAFDASGSSDSDGSIAKYEFDFDGTAPGLDWVGNGASPTLSHSYDTAGDYEAWVRVTDNLGATATAQLGITVTGGGGGNIAPTAALSSNVSGGTAPVVVDFDAGASSDSDGIIAKFEWDWDGDTVYDFDSATDATTSHLYDTAGLYQATVRVTDDDGDTDTQALTITVTPGGGGSNPPVAVLRAGLGRYGVAPLLVDFDARESSDDVGVVNYAWDFDNDGTDEESGPTLDIVPWSYQNPGVFDCHLTVSDADGQTDDTYLLVLVTPDASFPPSDSIFALPSQSFAHDGDHIGVEVYTLKAASPFQFPSARITMPSGNAYVPLSYNTGSFGGAVGDPDGVWKAMNPPGGFIQVPDSFFTPEDMGGGRVGIGFVVVPIGGSDLTRATGAVFNFELEVHTTVDFSFQREDSALRTFYQDGLSNNYFWNDDDNSGLPGITLL